MNNNTNVIVFTFILHPLIINEFQELKNHITNIFFLSTMPIMMLIKELISNSKIILYNIKYVILFTEIIFFNLNKFPLPNLIYWYLYLLYLLILDNKIHFKIIHAHWIYPPGIIATTYSKYIPKKIILTAHGYDADDRTFGNIKLKKLIIETGLKADCIITGERRLYNNLKTCGFKKIIFIQPFVELPRIDNVNLRKEKKISLDLFVVVFGPHLLKNYGVIDFVQAIIKTSTHIPNLFVICIGEGPETDVVKELFDKNNINYKITGKLSNSEVMDYLQVSDIVCSLGYLTQGIFTLEAFSCGKPVIGWNDIDEIKIEEGKTGLLTNLGNIDGLSKIIVKLYKDPQLRKEFGDQAKQVINTEYSKNNRISQILSIYI